MRKAFAAAVKAAGLDGQCPPHFLRHTAATWAMQARADLWQIAGFLGMTVEMLSGSTATTIQTTSARPPRRSPGHRDRNGTETP